MGRPFASFARFVRLAAVGALALAVWLVASPAAAASMAGLCGEQGTSEPAPAPLLIPVFESVETLDMVASLDLDALCGNSDDDASTVKHGERRFEPQSPTDVFLQPTAPRVGPRSVSRAHPAPVAEPHAPGVASSLERPPR